MRGLRRSKIANPTFCKIVLPLIKRKSNIDKETLSDSLSVYRQINQFKEKNIGSNMSFFRCSAI